VFDNIQHEESERVDYDKQQLKCKSEYSNRTGKTWSKSVPVHCYYDSPFLCCYFHVSSIPFLPEWKDPVLLP